MINGLYKIALRLRSGTDEYRDFISEVKRPGSRTLVTSKPFYQSALRGKQTTPGMVRGYGDRALLGGAGSAIGGYLGYRAARKFIPKRLQPFGAILGAVPGAIYSLSKLRDLINAKKDVARARAMRNASLASMAMAYRRGRPYRKSNVVSLPEEAYQSYAGRYPVKGKIPKIVSLSV